MPEVCRVEDINANDGKEVCVDIGNGKEWLMLFVRDGEVLAYKNSCPHQARALNFAPDRFLFTPERQLMCSHHGATFTLPDGVCVAGPCKGSVLHKLGTSVENGVVSVLPVSLANPG